ncbi:MAG: DUF2203 domain-containing protein [Actinomycetota bacterium]
MSRPEPPERFFTVEEANRSLDRLRTAIEHIQEARQIVLRTGERVHEAAPADGGGKEGAEYWTALRDLRQELEGLAGEGVILRDPESGLVDFPSRREGRTVYLCWRLDEDIVGHWHEVDAGFGGRKPL